VVRIGKWDEEKVLFKDTGHDHTGGTRGAHIQHDALATGCVILAATTEPKLSLWFGATSIDAPASIVTDLTSIRRAWLQEVATAAATEAIITATGGATLSVTPGAAGQTLWIFADGYV